jgi:hypothetical protein
MGHEVIAVTEPEAPKSTGTQFPYDVFISYSHKDKAWVTSEFLPELEKANLRVIIDDRDFEIGKPSAQNMVRAIEQVRHIIAILTPNWVASDWTGFEGYLVTTADPIGKQSRLLPLMLEPCKPPPHIAFLTYADFTDPARRPEEMERLLKAIRTHEELHDALPVHTSHTSEYARDGLKALIDLMRQLEAVRDTVVEFTVVFRDTRRQVEIVANYKDIHDELHEFQIQCYNRIIREMGGFPDDPLALENLIDSKLTLESKISNVRSIIARADYLASENAVLQSLQQGCTALDEALDKLDSELLKKSVRKLERVMALQPSRINSKLTAAARNLHLKELVKAMRTIHERITKLRVDEKKLRQFTDGVNGLEALHTALSALISEHDLWQQVDDRLHQIESDLDNELPSLGDSWNEVREMAAPLYAKKLEPWADVFRSLEKKLLTAIAEKNPAKTKSNFRLCRGRALDRFFQIDLSLKRSCENLRKIGEPLATVLDIL